MRLQPADQEFDSPLPLVLANVVIERLVETAYSELVKGEIESGEDSPVGKRVTPSTHVLVVLLKC